MEWRPLPLLLWLGLCISGLQAQVYGTVESREEGETLSVQCPYDKQQYREEVKAWCQVLSVSCSPIVSTQYTSQGSYQKEVTVERTTIQDDTDKGIVTVTVKMLQLQDAGAYMCTRTAHNTHTLKTIRLEVSQRLTTENVLTTLYTAPAFNFSMLDARYNGKPQSNGHVSFGGSSWLVLLLGALTTKTLMAVTIALLVRRRRRRGEAPEQVRSLDVMVPESSGA